MHYILFLFSPGDSRALNLIDSQGAFPTLTFMQLRLYNFLQMLQPFCFPHTKASTPNAFDCKHKHRNVLCKSHRSQHCESLNMSDSTNTHSPKPVESQSPKSFDALVFENCWVRISSVTGDGGGSDFRPQVSSAAMPNFPTSRGSLCPSPSGYLKVDSNKKTLREGNKLSIFQMLRMSSSGFGSRRPRICSVSCKPPFVEAEALVAFDSFALPLHVKKHHE